MLSSDDLQALISRARDAGLTEADARRATLLALPPVVRESLAVKGVPIDQLRSDLRTLNEWPTLIGHTPLIMRWLAQAVATTAPGSREALRAMLIFEGYGDLAASVPEGAPRRLDVLPEFARARRGTLLIYCRDDASKARRLGQALRLHLDQESGAVACHIEVSELGYLQPGDRWTIRAKAALADFARVVLCFGGRLVATERDPLLAQARCRLIPVLLPGAAPSTVPDWLHERTVFALPEDERYAGPWIDAIVELIGPTTVPHPQDWAAVNPYRGLHAFEPEHTHAFYGRGADTARLIDRIRAGTVAQRRLHTLVGTAGSGASSLARAGVVPTLRRYGIGDGRDWSVVILRDSGSPLLALAAATLNTIGVDANSEFHAALRSSPQALHTQIARRLGEERLLIVVDQVEEMLAQMHAAQAAGDADYVDGCRALFANLIHAARTPMGPVTVLLTVRVDHLQRLLAVDIKLNDAISAGQVLLPAMRADALEAAIVRPAQKAGRAFEPGLAAALVEEARARPGLLPALQLLLDRMWQTAPGDLLDADTRRGLGPLDTIIDRQTRDSERAIEQAHPTQELGPHYDALFARLVRIDEHAPDTCRRALRHGLAAPETLSAIVDTLIADGILSVTSDGRFDRVKLAHESLLTRWAALRAWREIHHTRLRYAHEVARAANLWQASGQSKATLWRGARAQLLLEMESTVPALAEPVKPFRDAVRRAHHRRRRGAMTVGLAALALMLMALNLWG